MVNSKELEVAFEWIDGVKELSRRHIPFRKVGKIAYVTDADFQKYLMEKYPYLKKPWRQYRDSRK